MAKNLSKGSGVPLYKINLFKTVALIKTKMLH